MEEEVRLCAGAMLVFARTLCVWHHLRADFRGACRRPTSWWGSGRVFFAPVDIYIHVYLCAYAPFNIPTLRQGRTVEDTDHSTARAGTIGMGAEGAGEEGIGGARLTGTGTAETTMVCGAFVYGFTSLLSQFFSAILIQGYVLVSHPC